MCSEQLHDDIILCTLASRLAYLPYIIAITKYQSEIGHELHKACSFVSLSAEAQALFHAPQAPTSIEEALQQRFNKYISCEQQAKADGNGSKARRMGRIAKLYLSAIKDYKAGKQVKFEELPVPPGNI